MISGILLPSIIQADGRVIVLILRSDILNVNTFTPSNLANYFERKSISTHLQTYRSEKAKSAKLFVKNVLARITKNLASDITKIAATFSGIYARIVHIDSL